MIKYTTINHAARLHLGLSLSQYSIADSIHKLSTNPKTNTPGWCSAKKDTLADFIGITRRGVIKIINSLEAAGLVERKGDKSTQIRTTEKWYTTVIEWAEFSKALEEMEAIKCEQSSHPSVNKVHTKCEQSSHPSVNKVHTKCEQSSHPTYSSIDSSIYNSIDRAPGLKSDLNKTLEERAQELVALMAADDLHLMHCGRIYRKTKQQLLDLIPRWAAENEATQFNSTQHKRNSFKRYVEAQQKKQPDSPSKMGGKMLIKPATL